MSKIELKLCQFLSKKGVGSIIRRSYNFVFVDLCIYDKPRFGKCITVKQEWFITDYFFLCPEYEPKRIEKCN